MKSFLDPFSDYLTRSHDKRSVSKRTNVL